MATTRAEAAESAPPPWSAIICADWSKNARRREVYAASPATRRVWRLDPPSGGWTVEAVVRSAERAGGNSRPPPLIGFDAPIGLPRSFLRSAGAPSFLGWLRSVSDGTFRVRRKPSEWSAEQPFFTVPGEKGGKSAFARRMAESGVAPLREIDKLANGNSVFITAGIPGSVGSSAIDIWQSLAPLLSQIALWPFDGGLRRLAGGTKPVVAEVYPRLAYGLAISATPRLDRRRLSVAKTDADIRRAFLRQLRADSNWVGRLHVELRNLEEAEKSEDAFDAFVTAAALLRCVLDGLPLSDPRFEDGVAEGGILGSGAVCLLCPERSFRPKGEVAQPGSASDGRPRTTPPRGGSGRDYDCPIGPRHFVFRGSRGGWDAHVGSVKTHPGWHPTVTDPRERCRLFRKEVPSFFQ